MYVQVVRLRAIRPIYCLESAKRSARVAQRQTYCQNKFVSSSLSSSTPQPGLQLLTVQLARFPISFNPSSAGSNIGSMSIGTGVSVPLAKPKKLSAAPDLCTRRRAGMRGGWPWTMPRGRGGGIFLHIQWNRSRTPKFTKQWP